jgi:hypothetical protein
VLVELSVMEQRYQAVLAVVQDGWKVTELVDAPGRLAPERPRPDRALRAGQTRRAGRPVTSSAAVASPGPLRAEALTKGTPRPFSFAVSLSGRKAAPTSAQLSGAVQCRDQARSNPVRNGGQTGEDLQERADREYDAVRSTFG